MHDQPDPSERRNSKQQPSRAVFHPRFAAFYEWFARSGQQRRLLDPLRQATAGEASGVVLEVGAGTGLNFAWYQATRVERVEAVEPEVVTLVLCSVHDPREALAEIKRVLKARGTLFVFEHVRSSQGFLAHMQDALVPVTTRLFGNCHWNRDAAHLVEEAGFQVTQVQPHPGGFPLLPHLLLQARRP